MEVLDRIVRLKARYEVGFVILQMQYVGRRSVRVKRSRIKSGMTTWLGLTIAGWGSP
jgi:hypothetical protein